MSTIQFNEPKHLLNSEVFPCHLLHKKRLTVRGLCGYEHAGLLIKAITKPSAHVPITIQYFPIINGCRLIPNRYSQLFSGTVDQLWVNPAIRCLTPYAFTLKGLTRWRLNKFYFSIQNPDLMIGIAARNARQLEL